MSKVGDVDDMVQHALYILKDENLPVFKKNALERAKEFDVTAIMPMYEAVYRRVLAKSVEQPQLSHSGE
jgi:glycosyltransferase involved in cell wall biosynthesis